MENEVQKNKQLDIDFTVHEKESELVIKESEKLDFTDPCIAEILFR